MWKILLGGENLNNKKCVCRLAGVILKKVL